MKIYKFIITGLLLITFACDKQYIDDITPVDQGPDTESPSVDVKSPSDLVNIPFTENQTDLTINFEVIDDIETESITVSLDGEQLATYDNFTDYRIFEETITVEDVGLGEYNLVVSATDLSGKTTTEEVDFTVTNEYVPLDGEIFYMPFEGESFLELISETNGTASGQVTFEDGPAFDAAQYDGSAESYVLFDETADIADVTNFSISFWSYVEFIDEDDNDEIDGVIGLVNLSNTSSFWGNVDIFIENGSGPTDGANMRIHVTNDDAETWIEYNNVTGIFDSWAHHVITYDNVAKEFKYYINNSLELTTNADWDDDLNFQNAGPLVMGTVQFQTDPSLTTATDSQTWASYLTGNLDEVKIFNIALSDTRVEELYNMGNPQ